MQLLRGACKENGQQKRRSFKMLIHLCVKLNAKDERNNYINNYKNVFLPGLMTRCTQLIEGNVPVSLGSNDIALQNQSQTKEEKSNRMAL